MATQRGTGGGPAGGGPTPDDGAAVWPPAPLFRRFGALVLDWILCVLVSAIFADPFTSGWPPVAILVLVYGFFLGLFGFTPGMYLSGLRCVSIETSGPVGIPRALLRGLLLVLVIPALIMDEQRRGLHDRAVGTIVVARPTETS